MTAETVINWVVEYRLPGKPWVTWPAPVDETGARQAYDAAVRSPSRGRIEYQLVKRTAVITDQVVLASGPAPEREDNPWKLT